MIPKVIWQTHEWEFEDLPYPYRMNALTWIIENPRFKYKYTSAAGRRVHIEMLEPSMLYIYDSILDNRYKADIWRYTVLKHYGGIYADMDSICLNDLIKLNLNSKFLIHGPSGDATCSRCKIYISKSYNNAFFGSEKNGTVVSKLIDHAKENFNIDQLECNHFSDPIGFSKVLIQNLAEITEIGPIRTINNGHNKNGRCVDNDGEFKLSVCTGNFHKNHFRNNQHILDQNSQSDVF